MDRRKQATDKPEYTLLVVDLDQSLVATDTLVESVLLYLKARPFGFFLLLAWLCKGKAHFKAQLAKRVCPTASLLPYRREVMEFAKRAKVSGKPVILATASHRRVAESVAAHVGLFSGILASDATNNLSGRHKLEAINAEAAGRPFAYIGDALVDMPIWETAHTAVVVEPTKRLRKALGKHPRVEIPRSAKGNGTIKIWIKALRLHQWAKNLLVFVPAAMAHRIAEPSILLALFLAYLSLSLTASSVYLLNDLLDLEADRKHSRKKNRPVASGTFSIGKAIFLVPLLFLAGLAVALTSLPLPYFFCLVFYLILTTLYSFYLKQQVILDVIALATLYTFRVIAGAIAVDIFVSSWLLAFSMFFFLSLALMKRYSEMLMMHEEIKKMPGRGYLKLDAATIMTSGITSGQLSLLVFALFMNDSNMQELYGKPQLLWLVLPVLFYWITRMWLLAHRGGMAEDPIVFTIKDRASWCALGIIILILLAASQQIDTLLPVNFLIP